MPPVRKDILSVVKEQIVEVFVRVVEEIVDAVDLSQKETEKASEETLELFSIACLKETDTGQFREIVEVVHTFLHRRRCHSCS